MQKRFSTSRVIGLLWSLILLFSFSSKAQVLVTNTNTASVLAKKLAGQGVVVSNAVMQCNPTQSGFFTTISSNLGEDSGIVLTTGLAGTNAPNWGVNGAAVNLANFNQGNGGDADLTLLAGMSTYDRCILEFDFVGNGDSIFFKYIFGSEEYPNYNCSNYNDVFGFFISGPGYPTPLNIALVPGTNIPVAINSINNGVIYPGGALSNCTSMGPGAPFTNLYVDNSAGTTITYSGFTQVLTSRAAIQPCSTYHLKLAIADGFDHILDSGVFLKAGSLTSNTAVLQVTTDSMGPQYPYVFEGCDTAIFKIKRKIFQSTANVDTFQLLVSGTATAGADYPVFQTQHVFSSSLSDTQKIIQIIPLIDLLTEGTEFIKVYLQDQCGSLIDSVRIDIKDPPKFQIVSNDTSICLGKSVNVQTTFDAGLNFSWSPVTGVVPTNVSNPIITPTATSSYILTGTYGTCVPKKDTLNITVLPIPNVTRTVTNLVCNGATNGAIQASTTSITLPLSISLNPPGTLINGNNANFTNLGAGIYTVTVTDGNTCSRTTTATITQPVAITWTSITGNPIPCNAGNVGLITSSASGGTGSLTYNLMPGNITNASGTFNNLGTGIYTITAKDANNCTRTSTVHIIQAAGLGWTNITSTPLTCNGISTGALSASATGGVGTINYVLNPGALTNTTGSFSALAAGIYTLSATDALGCTASTAITIIQPSGISINSVNVTNVVCNGAFTGSIQVNASGGNGSLTYTATPGGSTNSTGFYNGVSANTFTITVTDATPCTKSTVVIVTQPPAITFTVSNIVIPNCVPGNNGSLTASAVGGTGTKTYKINNGAYQVSGNFVGLSSGVYTVTALDAAGCTRTTIINLTTPNAPVITNTSGTITCANLLAPISVTASNGIAPYTYNLMPPNVTNSTGNFGSYGAGTYTVGVTGQNGCTSFLTITLLPAPALFWQQFIRTNPPCVGPNTGSLVSHAVGGVNPVNYTLQPTNITNTSGNFSGLAPGTYTITAMDANSCTITSVFTLTTPVGITINTTTLTHVACNGQATGAAVFSSTAVAPYTATRNPGGITLTNSSNFTGLSAGVYTITLADAAGCTANTTITINQAPIIAINNVISTNPSCSPGFDGSIAITAAGGVSPLTYALNAGAYQASSLFTNLPLGTYTIRVKDANNCTKTSTVALTNPSAPSFASLTSNQAFCSGFSSGTITAVATGGVSPITYSINPGGQTNSTGVFPNLPINTYTITLTDASNCMFSSTISIITPSQLAWTNTNVVGNTCFQSNNGSISVAAVGGIGASTYSVNPGGLSNASGNFNTLSAAVYTVTVTDANACTLTTAMSVTQPTVLSWSTLSSQNACNNQLGSITAVMSGGTPSYTYTIQPGNVTNITGQFNNLGPATYTVTAIDAMGCTKTYTFSILQSPLINITSSTQTVPTCVPGNDALITVTANGGSGSLLYNLSGGGTQLNGNFNNIGVGVYTVTVSDAIGCTQTTVFNISNPSSPVINTVSAPPILCFGNTVTLSVNATGGTAPLLYSKTPPFQSNASGFFPLQAAGSYTVTVKDANNCSVSSAITLTQPPLLIWDSVNNRDVSCFGGSNGLVVSSASGGAGTITYMLMPNNVSNTNGSFFGLGIGSYTLTATDSNGCSLTANFIINQAPPIVWNSVQTTGVLCNGASNGTATVNASGGNGTFSYKLQPGNITSPTGVFTNLAAGTYTITTTDAKSCTKTTVVNITMPNPITLNNTISIPASCNPGCNGSAQIGAAGGTPPYTYSLNGINFQAAASFSNLCTASYTVTIKDANNCTGTGIFTIGTTNGPVAINSSTQSVTCLGGSNGSASATVLGGNSPFSYTLQPGNMNNTTGTFTGLFPGTYSITVTDANGCTLSTSAIVNALPALLLATPSTTPVTCFGGNNGSLSVSASGGNNVYSFNLQPSNTTNTTGSFNGLTANTYTVQVTDGNNCTKTSTLTIITPTVLQLNTQNTSPVLCFGGNTGSLQWQVQGGTGSIAYNLQPGNQNNTNGNFNNLVAGVYTLQGTDANGCSITSTLSITQPTVLNITGLSTTVPSCNPGNDATATVTASGGTTPYTYSINGVTFQNSNIITGLDVLTYTITVKDANQCTKTSVFSINPPPTPLINNVTTTQATCVPGCDGSLTISASGGTAPLQYQLMNGPLQSGGQFNALCAGTYTVVVQDANQCTQASIASVNTTLSPQIQNTFINDVLCFGGITGTVSLQVNSLALPITYTLQPGNVTNTTGAYTNLSAGIYTITGVDMNGCTLSTIFAINQPPVLTIASAFSTPAICNNGATGTIILQVNGGWGTINLALQPNAGTILSPGMITNLPGNQTYTLTATDANGCTAQSTVFVANPPPVQWTQASTAPVICNGAANGNIQVQAQGGTGTLTYSIQPGAINNTTGQFNGLSGNTYTVTVTDANNCSQTTIVTVFEPTALQWTTTTASPITCFGFGNGSLNTGLSGGTGIITYSLLPGNIQNTTGQYNNLQAGNYTVQGTDANGCTQTTVLTITEPAPLTWQPLSISMVSCFGLSNASISAPVIGGTGTLTYTLQPGNVNNTSGTFNNLQAGIYSIQVADANACSLSTVITITQPTPLLLSSDSTHNITCHNGTDGFISTSATGGTLPFTFTLQPALGTNNNGVFSNLPAGSYTVQVTDAQGCTFSVSPIVLTQPNPIVFTSVLHQDIQCYQDTAGTISVQAQGGTGNLVYSLIPNLGTQPAQGQFINLPGGTYTVVATDASGCAATTTVLINQNVQLVISLLNTTEPLCYGNINGSINIVATGGVPPLTYALNGGAPANNGLFTPLGAGNYTVTMMDNQGCKFDTTVVLNQPDPLHMPMDIFGAYCVNEADARIVFYPTGGTPPYTFWLNPGSQLNTSGQFQNLAPGNYTTLLTDANGCKLDTSFVIPVPANPLQVSFQKEDLGCFGWGTEGWAEAIPVGGTSPYTFLWNTTPIQTTAKAEQLRSGYYVVDVVDARGCTVKDTVQIIGGLCCDQVYIPNAFTPNNDGNNDTWHVVTSAGIKILQYEVYNRWGNLLWRGLNPADAWNGIFQNTLQDSGTYFYQFRYQCLSTGEIFQFSGDITLIR